MTTKSKTNETHIKKTIKIDPSKPHIFFSDAY